MFNSAGIPPIILIKIIMDDPFPSFSSVINSANHIDNMDPVVRDKITSNATLKSQLNVTGLTKANATPVLIANAQTNVK